MLEVEQLNFSYGEVKILHEVSLRVPLGSIVSLMGRNGVGKTTLLRNVVGLEKPSHGSISLDGETLNRKGGFQRVKAGIGYVPQGRQIFPKLTVEENLHIGMEGRSDSICEIPSEIYRLFPICKEMGKRMGGDLSGGQQQQLAIARALAGNPKILILDEPTEGIQPNVIQQIGGVLRHLAQHKKMGILLVEQYLDFVKEHSDRFYVMNRGRIVAHGANEDLNDSIIKHYLSV
ncbi:MAG: urea ABC transporter ATP-binding subunit UrtE [Verrucomicrobiota bacterium]|jgi:urea transport system ATP-binding protein|nr:urea ABC transporter ATP-binding subunit UrtE [Verrucomicrobiota bacterium]